MKLSDLDLAQKQHVQKKLKELKDSDGWNILCQIMSADREILFRKVASPGFAPNPENINYHRGVIEASYKLAELPDTVIGTVQNEIQLAAATAAAKAPPKKT